MRIKPEFAVCDVAFARDLIRRHPFATIVAADLQATHMPCLVDEGADGLAVLGHVAKADPVAGSLATGPLLLVFQAVHGYVSASWYRTRDLIPTWNHVTVHVRGRAEVVPDAREVLARTVDHMEQAVEDPWSLSEMDDDGRGMAREVLGFRLEAEWWHAEAKLSQDKPAELRRDVRRGLAAPGPYRNQALAGAMDELGT